ncbi:MAG: c-type cytochrome [Flavobacteriaceae bacterium]|nr:c-type cytochrome [Flavobacteriaceae bacterium]
MWPKEKRLYWKKHCASCHGKKGLGDGTKAKEVEGDLGDSSSAELLGTIRRSYMLQELYIGRKDMPNFEEEK